jgi:hypothetical protein
MYHLKYECGDYWKAMGALETGILEQNDRTMSVLSVTLVQRADTRRSELCSSAPAAACDFLLL